MSNFAINSNPVFNTTSVPRINQTDAVLDTFMNSYLEIFLNNDQALKGMVDDQKKSITELGNSVDNKVKELAPIECSEADLMAPFIAYGAV